MAPIFAVEKVDRGGLNVIKFETYKKLPISADLEAYKYENMGKLIKVGKFKKAKQSTDLPVDSDDISVNEGSCCYAYEAELADEILMPPELIKENPFCVKPRKTEKKPEAEDLPDMPSSTTKRYLIKYMASMKRKECILLDKVKRTKAIKDKSKDQIKYYNAKKPKLEKL